MSNAIDSDLFYGSSSAPSLIEVCVKLTVTTAIACGVAFHIDDILFVEYLLLKLQRNRVSGYIILMHCYDKLKLAAITEQQLQSSGVLGVGI